MSDAEDRMLSMRLDMSTDETAIDDVRQMARLTIAILEDSLRKLREYANEATTEPPSWWQGSVVNEGEVVAYRWSELDPEQDVTGE